MKQMCKNCGGSYPCWCNKPFYVKVWDFVFEAILRTKGK